MFGHKKIEEDKDKEQVAAADQPVQDFLQIWLALKAETKDKIRLGRLELRLDKAWESLAQDQKDAAWMIIFPEQRKVKEIFDAHVVKIK